MLSKNLEYKQAKEDVRRYVCAVKGHKSVEDQHVILLRTLQPYNFKYSGNWVVNFYVNTPVAFVTTSCLVGKVM